MDRPQRKSWTRLSHSGSPTSPLPSDFSTRVKSVRPGTPYVLAVLRADREYSLNTARLAYAWRWLAPGVVMPAWRQYTVIVGRVGERPVLVESQDRPYRVRVTIEPFDFDVRMESWLPTDTIRRAGFGHVVVNRRHALTLERGISFVALGPGAARLRIRPVRPHHGMSYVTPAALIPS